MKIVKADIQYLKSGSFCSVANEGVRHVKILPFLSVVQVTEGSYDISLGSGVTEPIGEGGFFIAPAHVKQTIVHHVNPESKKMSARWLFLDVEINESWKLDLCYRFPVAIGGATGQALSKLFDGFWDSDDIFAKYSICYKILEILMSEAEVIRRPKQDGVSAAVAYMTEHMTQQITVAELAQIAHMSESSLYSAFKKQFGSSPIAYLNHYRLSVAAERLSTNARPVKEIACSVGIRDALYFSKLFKNEYGVSPREYRQSHKNESELVK